MIPVLLLFALTFFGDPDPQPGFLGLWIGMKASVALPVASKRADALEYVTAHSGQRVISDSLTLTHCSFPMRRSLGFDTSGTLTAVGLTYKTTQEHIAQDSDCAFQWLAKAYGAPTGEAERDGVTQEVWQYDGVKLTFETRQYNSRDVFVLIYYYKDEKVGK